MRPLVRVTLATKFSAVIVGVVVLAAAGSALTLGSLWDVGRRLEKVIANNVASVRAANELEIALLRQGGGVSRYFLDDGNPSHLSDLSYWRAEFEKWLGRAQSVAHTPEEDDILRELTQVYRAYDAKRDEAIALYDRGDAATAKAVLLRGIRDLSERAFILSEDLIAENERYLDAAMDAAAHRIRWATWLAAAAVSATVGIGLGLIWLFLSGVVVPLRRMTAEVRAMSDAAQEGTAGQGTDELHAVSVYLRSLMSDVTSARAAAAQARRRLLGAEKLASVGKLAASVAHELRNPLTAVKMWLFSIQKTIGPDEDLDRKFQAVSEEIARMENVVRNFLEFSRPPTLRLQLHDVPLLLDNTMDLVAHHIEGKNIRIVRDDARPLPRVKADADQLKQVFVNLLQNAAEAMAEGSEIHFSAGPEADADGRTMVVVRVRDTGPGMPEEVRQRIFEPFYTTKDDGTGLGLCIAARIMARHGGRLVLESSTPQGTVFAVRIPAAEVETDE